MARSPAMKPVTTPSGNPTVTLAFRSEATSEERESDSALASWSEWLSLSTCCSHCSQASCRLSQVA